jgi:hypothetical protein
MNLPFVISVVVKIKKTESPAPELLGLRPLHPDDSRLEHDIYVEEIRDALKKEMICNIALTGGYGSGKSSILSRFVKISKN